MNKEERLQIVYQIGDLIESNCKGCEHNSKVSNRVTDNACLTSCSIGKELRELGEMLVKPKEEGA